MTARLAPDALVAFGADVLVAVGVPEPVPDKTVAELHELAASCGVPSDLLHTEAA